MTGKIVFVITAVLGLLLLANCQKASNMDQMDLTNGNSQFAFDLLKTLKKSTEENSFFSPYSISTALAMTFAGAKGHTANQMKSTLRFTLPAERLHRSFASLGQKLAGNSDFKLSIVNSIWGQQGYRFLPSFISIVKGIYKSEIKTVDYMAKAEEARGQINKWVAERTNDKIKELLSASAINRSTRMVLVNAIYFKADWQKQFVKEATRDMPFNLLKGGNKQVPMMYVSDAYNGYLKGKNFEAIQLPYKGNNVSMTIIVPSVGQFAAVKSSLNEKFLKTVLSGLRRQRMDLTMPKFKFESKFSLKNTLMKLGMTEAFSDAAADFSGMDGTRKLKVSDVIHNAFVAVDEKGTEAAAATAVTISLTSAIMEPNLQVDINRPFVFFIHDELGNILFMGQVIEPLFK